MRQVLCSEAPISASQADKVLKQTQRETYQRLPSAGAQRTTQVLENNWKGVRLNSDVNGAANILRKEIGDDWLISQIEADQGVMDTPAAIKHIDLLLEAGLRPRETLSNREST